MKPVVTAFPKVGIETRTRTATNRLRHEVARDILAKYPDEDIPEARERFAQYALEDDTLAADTRWPEAHTQLLRDEAWERLDQDIDDQQNAVIVAALQESKREIDATTAQIKTANAGDVTGLLNLIDRTPTIQGLHNLFEREVIIGNRTRLRDVLPIMLERSQAIAKTTTKQDLKDAALRFRVAADEWSAAHPAPLDRLRQLQADEQNIVAKVTAKFDKMRRILGMRVGN